MAAVRLPVEPSGHREVRYERRRASSDELVGLAALYDGEDEQRQHADGHEDDDGSGRQ